MLKVFRSDVLIIQHNVRDPDHIRRNTDTGDAQIVMRVPP